jgi:hypothetical protein
MKKNNRNKRRVSKREPSAKSLKEIPELDFKHAVIRRNPYAERASKGIRILAPPSAASLEEIPELDFSKAKVRRNPYATRAAKGVTVKAGKHEVPLQMGKGKPPVGRENGGTEPRSLRFPPAVWEEIERLAESRGLTLHAALREAVLRWIKDVA